MPYTSRDSKAASEYQFDTDALSHCHDYVLPDVLRLLEQERVANGTRRVFELGCGNGSVAKELQRRGFEVTAVDVSKSGIEIAQRDSGGVRFEIGSAYDPLAERYGRFGAVLSLEVVEHLYDPRKYASNLHALLEPNGLAVLSTPYHGYLKNLALAVAGRMDAHFTALWDHGHIKFWSTKTLRALLEEAGFRDVRFIRVGRIPPLAKSMIAVARRAR